MRDRRIIVSFLTVLLFIPGLLSAQPFNSWGELRVLGLGEVWSLEYSPDGTRLAAGGTGGVRYLDTDSYEIDTQMHGAGAVRTISWSPDGKRIVSLNRSELGGAVKIWDAETGELIRTHQESEPVTAWQAAWSPDGSLIAAAFTPYAMSGMVRIWDAETGEEFTTIRPGQSAGALGWSQDGTRIATAGTALRVWDVQTGTLVQTLAGPASSVESIRWSPDDSKVAAGSFDQTARVWDVQTGRTLQVFTTIGPVVSVTWSPDGRKLATGDSARLVRIWDVETGRELMTLSHGGRLGDVSVSWSPDGSQLASGSVFDPKLIIWDAETYEPLKTITIGHTGPVLWVQWSPDGKRLASASPDKTIKIWDAETGEVCLSLLGRNSAVQTLSWSPDAERLASGSEDGTVTIWNAETGRELKTFHHGASVRAVSWSTDGKKIASGSFPGVKIWDVETGQQILAIPDASNPLSWSPDNSKIAAVTGIRFNLIGIWEAETGREVNALVGNRNEVFSVVWSPDGEKIASSSNDYAIRVWNAETGEEVWSRIFDAVGISWSPDSRYIAVGSSPWFGLLIWDAESGERLRDFQGHDRLLNTVNWSPDGSRIASGAFDMVVRIWGEKPK